MRASRRDRSVLFIVRGDATVPSCRFRAYQYREPLERLGVHVDYLVIEKSRSLRKQLQFHRRLFEVGSRYAAIVYQKQLEPWRMRLAGARGARVFFDFDDAIYLDHSKFRFEQTLRAADAVLAGNETLATQARRFHDDVSIVPTTVEVPPEIEPPDAKGPLQLLWVGTSANLPAVKPVFAAVEQLRAQGEAVQLEVVTERPERVQAAAGVSVRKWSRDVEDEALRTCTVGLMPLEDTPWSRGKCACKALQYLAYGKPVVTSPVGVNREIFEGASFGLLVEHPEAWTTALRTLAQNRVRFAEGGLEGRAFVRDHYGVDVWASKLVDRLFG